MANTDAGNFGEEAVRDELRKLKGNLISGFIRSNNICYYGKNFQIDFLLFVPSIGLVLLEVKNWKGTVKATSEDIWVQEIGTYKNELKNASLQSLRTAGLLLHILEKGKLNKWPIRPIVVFVNQNAKIQKSKIRKPQTDIILKTMIGSWIEENSLNEIYYKFTNDEFIKVKEIICEYTKEYNENS